MEEKPVLYSRKDGIARIVLNRPERLNAFNEALLEGLAEAIDRARLDHETKVVVLTGQGRAFCAGVDIGDLQRLSRIPPTESYPFMLAVNRAARKLIQFPKPLLSAINGPAMGGGCGFALSGDVVIASEKATFGFVFSRFNLISDTGASFILPRLIGSVRLRDLIFNGRIISATEAEAYGLVTEVVPERDFEETVNSRAHQMSEWPPEAFAMNKLILEKAETGGDLDTVLELEARTQSMLFSSPDSRERIEEFLKNKS